jgi:glycosyltransferase involved in cell wall biosynthesis
MISVIIPSYNSEATIGRCLASLESQVDSPAREVILVDSSNDCTVNIVSKQHPKIQVIHLDQKTDPGTARNLGIEKSRGEILAFIDSDCIADRNWLRRITEAHASAYRVIGGAVQNGNDKASIVAWAGYLSEFREFLPTMGLREVMHIPTCNISYKKEIFSQFGLFEGRYYPQEDLVYNYRLWKNGEKILLDPSIRVHHVHRVKASEFFRHQNKIGAATSRVLKILPLQGSFLANHPYLATASLPMLCATKFARTMSIFLKYQPDVIRKRPEALLLLFAGLLFWGYGFAKGAFDRG